MSEQTYPPMTKSEFYSAIDSIRRDHGPWIMNWLLGWLQYDLTDEDRGRAIAELIRCCSSVIPLPDREPGAENSLPSSR